MAHEPEEEANSQHVLSSSNKDQNHDASAAAAAPSAAPPPPQGPQKLPILPIHVSLLRFTVLLVISWLFAYAAMSSNAEWVVDTYIPWSFWLLHYLVIFGIVGGGWPLVAPFGMDMVKPFWDGHGRVVLGLVMTGLVVGIAALLSSLFVAGLDFYPENLPWFGIGLFWMSLWWVLDIQISAHPVIPPTAFPPLNMAMHSTIIILLAVAVFQFVDYDPPFQNDKSNPEGPAGSKWWFGCVVSIIVWVHNFASILVFQCWPFSLLASIHPYVQHVTLTAATVALGWGIYEIVIAWNIDYGFFADAIGASQISWSLFHTVAFDFWPFHNMVQPKRGMYAFFFSQVVLPFFWIWLCRIMLQPIYDKMAEANPVYGILFTVNTMIPWYSLHVVAPLLLIHHSFFMRWPLPPGGPPMGPMDVGVVMDFDDNNGADDADAGAAEERVELVKQHEKGGEETGVFEKDEVSGGV